MQPRLGAVALLIVLMIGIPAHADDTGAVGTIVALDLNTPSADVYLAYHGRAFVEASPGVLDEYRWGGTACGTRVLAEADVAVLQRALGQKGVTIQPRSQPGQGESKCLVGFRLVPKGKLKLFP